MQQWHSFLSVSPDYEEGKGTLAISPNHIHASACKPAAKGTQNTQVSLFSAEYKNLSLFLYSRAGFNKIRGTIIEISTPLSKLINTLKLLKSEQQIDKWT